MFTKEIRYLKNVDWVIQEYTDADLIEMIKILQKEIPVFEELYLFLDEDEYAKRSLVVSVQSSGMQLLNCSRYIFIHKIIMSSDPAEMECFRKEIYRIKRMLKKSFPDKTVRSQLYWK